MYSRQSSSPSESKSNCLTILFRRRQIILPASCFLYVFFILFVCVGFTNRSYTKQAIQANADASEVRHVHECHCLVNFAVPTNTREASGSPTQKVEIPIQQMVINPREKITKRTVDMKGSDSEISLLNLKSPDNIWQRITLKPNFTQMINASQTINTLNATYTLENPTLCSSVRNLAILVIVHTAPDHKDRRFSIRNTWANDAFYHHLGNVRTLFLLGKPKDQSKQYEIEDESKRYGDILQGDFIDDYHNLTLKGVMAYKWLTERCRNAELILKVDDDISVDMFRLFTVYYPEYRTAKMALICNHFFPNTSFLVRDKTSKWYVSNNHFRGLDAYPTDYCSGFMVIFTNDLIPALYQSSKVTPFFWVDDVYLYGLVPSNVPGVKYISLTGNWTQLDGQEALRCYRNATKTCPFLVAGAGLKGEPEELWPQMVKRYALSSKVIDGKT